MASDESTESTSKAKNVPQELADQNIVELVESLPAEKRLELVRLLEFSVEASFSGPLPPPEHFAKYDEILPDAANRIMTLAENEQKIRADRQAGVLANDRTRVNRATLMGLSLIAVALVATYLGQPAIALPLGLVGTLAAWSRQVMDWLDRRQTGKDPAD